MLCCLLLVLLLTGASLYRGLSIALGGRDEASLEPLLAFLARHIANPKYASLLIDVAHAVADTYSSVLGDSEGINELFKRLNKQVSIFYITLHFTLHYTVQHNGACDCAACLWRQPIML
jgi:UTP15 C terminal